MARMLKLDPGISAGLYAGALTQSASIGTATDAIMNLPVPIEERRPLANQVAEAYGPSYVFGAIGIITFGSLLAPRLQRVDLRQEVVVLEQCYGIKSATAGVFTAYQKFAIRAYQLSEPALVGTTVGEFERRTGLMALLLLAKYAFLAWPEFPQVQMAAVEHCHRFDHDHAADGGTNGAHPDTQCRGEVVEGRERESGRSAKKKSLKSGID